jgi:hypothetical protein
MKWFLIILVSIIIIVYVFYRFSGEDERIKTLLRIYKREKNKNTKQKEIKILSRVAEEHILPGKSIKLKQTGVSGELYIKEVFEGENIDLTQLIRHIICLEYPQKYKKMDIKKIRYNNRNNIPNDRDLLTTKIATYYKKILN